jgi:hypothetical protein
MWDNMKEDFCTAAQAKLYETEGNAKFEEDMALACMELALVAAVKAEVQLAGANVNGEVTFSLPLIEAQLANVFGGIVKARATMLLLAVAVPLSCLGIVHCLMEQVADGTAENENAQICSLSGSSPSSLTPLTTLPTPTPGSGSRSTISGSLLPIPTFDASTVTLGAQCQMCLLNGRQHGLRDGEGCGRVLLRAGRQERHSVRRAEHLPVQQSVRSVQPERLDQAAWQLRCEDSLRYRRVRLHSLLWWDGLGAG